MLERDQGKLLTTGDIIYRAFIGFEGLYNALDKMASEGKVDLEEINTYFRAAVGQTSTFKAYVIAGIVGIPVSRALGQVEEFTKPDFQLFRNTPKEALNG